MCQRDGLYQYVENMEQLFSGRSMNIFDGCGKTEMDYGLLDHLS